MSKLLEDLAKPDPLSVALAVTSTEHILINTEGRVHRNTFLQQRNNSTRQRMVSEKKVGRKWLGGGGSMLIIARSLVWVSPFIPM